MMNRFPSRPSRSVRRKAEIWIHRRCRPLVQRGCATRPRALERPCQQCVSPRLSALGRARLDQLGGRNVHGCGGTDGPRGPCRVPHRTVGRRRPQCRVGAECGGRSEAPSSSAQERGGKGRVGRCHADGHGARRRHHIRSGTLDAHVGCLRRARPRRPPQRRRCGREAHHSRRCGHARSSGRRACAVFAATGVRLRHLPIRPAAVLQGLAS